MPDRTIKPGQGRGSRRTPLVLRGPNLIQFIPDEATGPHDVDPVEMSAPYQCDSCGKVYDGGHVTVLARYVDCSLWKCPGCGRQHDSRHAWSSGPGARMGYTDLRAAERSIAERRAQDGWAPIERTYSRNSTSSRGRGRRG